MAYGELISPYASALSIAFDVYNMFKKKSSGTDKLFA